VKARIVALDSDEHRTAQELLPWFVNGTLDGAEAALVAAHLARCSRCQGDAAEQARLRAIDVGAPSAGDVDRDWLALRSRLETAPTLASHRPVGTLRRWWMQWLPMTVAVQAAVLLGIAIALTGRPVRDEPYRALGAAPAVVEANAVAVFRSDATNRQMADALRSVGARIVDGPTVTDAYMLRIADASPEAMARLRAQPAVLRAESLQGEAPR
jgi:hypothetical protein